LLFIIIDTELEPPAYTCELHEEFICGLTCIESCDYKPDYCQKDCRFGCFCKEGYVRQSNDTTSPCIKREKCGQQEVEHKCCKNQEYQACGSACPSICDDFSFPLPKPEKMCIAVCRSGCFCKQGYIRQNNNTNSPCILEKKC